MCGRSFAVSHRPRDCVTSKSRLGFASDLERHLRRSVRRAIQHAHLRRLPIRHGKETVELAVRLHSVRDVPHVALADFVSEERSERHLRRVDKAICGLLAEVRRAFPDAAFYTASGGFNLMLGNSHGTREEGQQQLVALSGAARIGDGDF